MLATIDGSRFGVGRGRSAGDFVVLKSRPVDPDETERRVRAALRKHERGEALTEKEELIVYWTIHGGGCHACGGVRIVVGSAEAETEAEARDDVA